MYGRGPAWKREGAMCSPHPWEAAQRWAWRKGREVSEAVVKIQKQKKIVPLPEFKRHRYSKTISLKRGGKALFLNLKRYKQPKKNLMV